MRKSKSLAVFLACVLVISSFSGCAKRRANAGSSGSVGSDVTASEGSIASGSVVSGTSSSNSSTSVAKGKSSSNEILSAVSRTIASNAGSAPQKTETVSVPSSVQLQIKPIQDHTIKENVKNMNGKLFKFATFWPDHYETSSVVASAYRKQAIANIEKAYNCKIDLIALSTSTYMKDINTAKAAGKVYADIFETQTGFEDFITGGIFANLRTVSSVNLAGYDWNPAFNLVTTYKNGVYGVNLDYSRISRACLMYDKVIAAKYNLGNLYTLVKNKQWTFDEFQKLSQQVYAKSNKQISGMVSFNQYWAANLVYANNGSPTKLVGGKVLFNGTDNNVLTALNFLQNYSKLGLINQKIFAEDDNDQNAWSATSAFSAGKSLFLMCDDYMPNNISASTKDDYGILPLPIGPNASNYKCVITNCEYYSLFNQDRDIEDAGIIMDAIANRCSINIASYDKMVAPVLRDSDSLDMIHLIMQSDLTFIQGGDSKTGGLIDYDLKAVPAIVKMAQTPQQAVQAISKSVQAQMNKYYSN